MYEAVTRGIRIRVTPQYLDDQSTPEDGEFFWAYTIDIANESGETVQLRSRVWRITDGHGQTEEVRGPGVVGETPTIAPGKSFTYTSGCPLRTPSGIMMAAVSDPIACSTAARSPNGTWSKPSTGGPKPSRYFSLPPAAMVASVRP